jgi:predicted metal-dependent hydrolase
MTQLTLLALLAPSPDVAVAPAPPFAPPGAPPPPSAGLTDTRLVFVRHRRARRYVLRVLDDGSLRVTMPRWGSRREALRFVESSHRWILKERASRQNAAQNRPETVAARADAVQVLPRQLLALAAQLGIAVARVSIRDQRSRWGACSTSGTITLNWRLVLMPDWVCEYVMVHELMHRREMNHSARFWRHVAAACPRFIEARRWLTREGRALR